MNMNDANSKLNDLTSIFRALGASDADARARSEIAEGIPQLATFLFLKLATTQIDEFLDHHALREAVKVAGCRDALDAFKRLAASESGLKDFIVVLRTVLSHYVTEIAFLLDDTAASRFSGWPFESALENIHWGLFQTDADGKPTAIISGLHEVIHEFLAPVSEHKHIAQQGGQPEPPITRN